MMSDSQNVLTYVLSNGDERTIPLNGEKLHDIINWFHDKNSFNSYQLKDGKTVLFKDTILSVKY